MSKDVTRRRVLIRSSQTALIWQLQGAILPNGSSYSSLAIWTRLSFTDAQATMILAGGDAKDAELDSNYLRTEVTEKTLTGPAYPEENSFSVDLNVIGNPNNPRIFNSLTRNLWRN